MKLRPGVTLGLGVSLDTQNLNEAAHKVRTGSNLIDDRRLTWVKVGTSFEFEG